MTTPLPSRPSVPPVSPRLPVAMPRWLQRLGRVLDWLLPVVLLLAAPGLALGNAATVPERQATLRELLGYAPGAPFRFEGGRWGLAELELAVDAHVALPEAPVGSAVVRATSVRLLVHSRNGQLGSPQPGSGSLPTVAQVYQWTSTDAVTWYSAQFPPCVSPDQTARALAGPGAVYGYTCLTEEELVALSDRVVSMSLWERADWPMVARLQALHGASGVPVVTWASPVLHGEDERATSLPSVLRWWVYYQFVLPAPGFSFSVPSGAP